MAPDLVEQMKQLRDLLNQLTPEQAQYLNRQCDMDIVAFTRQLNSPLALTPTGAASLGLTHPGVLSSLVTLIQQQVYKPTVDDFFK